MKLLRDLPLELVWETSLPEAPSDPVFGGGRLAVRCHHELVSVSLADGLVRWRVRVARPARKRVLAIANDRLVTDDCRDATSYLRCVDWDGTEHWTSQGLRGLVGADAVWERPDGLYVLTGRWLHKSNLYRLDLVTGRTRGRDELPRALTVVWGDGGLLVAAAEAGLMQGDSCVVPGPLQAVEAAGTRIAVVHGRKDALQVEVRSLHTLVRLWGGPVARPLVGMEGDDVLIVVEDCGRHVPVLRDARTGEERWRCEPIGPYVAPALCGPFALFVDEAGTRVHRRKDGHWIGRTPLRLGAGHLHDGYLYVPHESSLLCLNLAI